VRFCRYRKVTCSRPTLCINRQEADAQRKELDTAKLSASEKQNQVYPFDWLLG
jgi:hypothetical protein